MKCASVNTDQDIISVCVVPVKLQLGDSAEVLEICASLDNCIQDNFVVERFLTKLRVQGRKIATYQQL